MTGLRLNESSCLRSWQADGHACGAVALDTLATERCMDMSDLLRDRLMSRWRLSLWIWSLSNHLDKLTVRPGWDIEGRSWASSHLSINSHTSCEIGSISRCWTKSVIHIVGTWSYVQFGSSTVLSWYWKSSYLLRSCIQVDEAIRFSRVCSKAGVGRATSMEHFMM